jgi:hypothetical protein
MRCSIKLYKFAKWAQITFGAVAKRKMVIGYHLDPFASNNDELHATSSMSAIYRWEKFILNQLKDDQLNKCFYNPRSIYIS